MENYTFVSVDALLDSRTRALLDAATYARRYPLYTNISRFDKPGVALLWRQDRQTVAPSYILELAQAKVVHQGAVITSDDRVIDASVFGFSGMDGSISCTETGVSYTGAGCTTAVDAAVVIKKIGAINYGHWLVEMLPKVFFAYQQPALEGVPIIIQRTTGNLKRAIFDSLEAIGFPLENVIETGNDMLCADTLFYPTPVTWHPVTKAPAIIPLFEQLAAPYPQERQEILFISRADTDRRRLMNEKAVIESLRRRWGSVRVLFPASMTFQEQVRTFANARCIVGPMGAGLVNSLFAPADVPVLVLCSEQVPGHFFWDIACLRKTPYYHLFGSAVAPTVMADYLIDPGELEACLDAMAGVL